MASHSAQDKIRVLRVIGRLNVGGPSIHVVNLAAGLDPSRYEQLLVIGHESPAEGSMLDYALSRGVWPHRIQEIVTAFNLAPRDGIALKRLFSLMRLYRPHIVHTHTAKAGLLGRMAAHLAGVPIIVHTFHGHVLHGYYGPVQNWALRRMETALAWFTHRLVAVSEQVKKELVEYGVAGADRISVIPLGLELAPFLDAEKLRGEFRREMGFTSDVKLVGIVGRIFPIKNHALFLKSAACIAAAEAAARFVVVGDGMLRFALEQQAGELDIADRTLFTGWRSDLARIYADLDVLVVSSNNEGTPLSAIEAMAARCPVVATRVGGLPDLIEDQKTGRLVPPRDAEALASAVLDLLNNPQTACELGQNAMEAVRQRFTVQRLLSDMDHLYTELLEEKAIDIPATERFEARG
ncbi:MAG TPA: glycosyltransferase [Candidatus Binatia bacterium]|jgi:glycosyltransferase involved in cell wall biosynthesis|nr:glycosyltransferase [Candidatus Binatia bacterium]